MIHGLFSSPLMWRHLTNAIYGDPILQSRVQVWHYMYPTGLPTLMAAQKLRDDLDSAEEMIHSLGLPPHPPMVLIGHSMGGLLARTMVTDPGEQLWDAAFSVPPSSFHCDPDELKTMTNFFIFTPRSYVGRVIFLATPSQGSSLVNNILARTVRAFISPPSSKLKLYNDVVYANKQFIRPEAQWLFSDDIPSSLDTLSPRNPILMKLSQLPISPKVPFNVIYGNGDDNESDGVVTVASAHIAGAESELGVKSGHNVGDNPEAIQEVLRILKEQVEQYDKSVTTIVSK
jgi:pimeloyl-ACP methyl ester carboxylesterase